MLVYLIVEISVKNTKNYVFENIQVTQTEPAFDSVCVCVKMFVHVCIIVYVAFIHPCLGSSSGRPVR